MDGREKGRKEGIKEGRKEGEKGGALISYLPIIVYFPRVIAPPLRMWGKDARRENEDRGIKGNNAVSVSLLIAPLKTSLYLMMQFKSKKERNKERRKKKKERKKSLLSDLTGVKLEQIFVKDSFWSFNRFQLKNVTGLAKDFN